MEQYPWDLEERVEDAFVALLKIAIGDAACIIAARTVTTARYPLIVVEAGDSDNANDDATFNGMRRLDVTVALTTEAVNRTDKSLLQDAREKHRAVKSQVIGVLASKALQDALNALGVPGVQFSMAHLTAQRRDAGDGKLTTEQDLDVIACPKEI